MRRIGKGLWLVALVVALGAGAPAASADPSDPLFVFTPTAPSTPPPNPIPPPSGDFEGPCGLAVDGAGNFYLSDYYHHAVDVLSPAPSYLGQLANEDPLDGPCGLALDGAGNLYLNNYHRNVVKFAAPGLSTATVIAGAPLDASRPTGLAVDPATGNLYINDRTQIAAYDSSGAALKDGEGNPLRIGSGSLKNGYGLAFSRFAATKGFLYVPDAATETVKVYDPASDVEDPVATISGPPGGFSSLRDAAVAVDRLSGVLYVADDLQPTYTEHPEATIYAFNSGGAYLGHLKYNVIDAAPVGLAVDNSTAATQGRVYVSSGDSAGASVYAYPPGAVTTAPSLCAPGGDCLGVAAGVGAGLSAPGAVGRTVGGAAGPPPSAAASAVAQQGTLRVSLSGRLSPRSLPRSGVAPIAVSLGGEIATSDQSQPPQLKTLRIEINRHGRLDYTGLPSCPYRRIQPASSSRALAACRAALLGKGSFSADITLAGQEPYPTQGQLLLFNGKRHGRPVLFGQIYSPHPFATSFVIVFGVQRLGRGAYGTALSATLPEALGSWGNLTGIEMRLSRRYSYRGSRHSYLSAGCPAPKGFPGASFPLARASFGFAGGESLSSVLGGSCRVRG